MQKIVLDTNILVSAMLSINGNPARVVSMILDGKLSVCYNSKILSEYNNVLYRPRFSFDVKKVQNVVNVITELGVEFMPTPSDFPMIDETDRIFYDTAKSSGSILITGNIKHFPKEVFIQTISDFLTNTFG
jgi:putative PIN family toxin of toxin-antitoxin system